MNGYLVPQILCVMDVLAQFTPAYRFPANTGRQPEETPWVRGGTSPGGSIAGGDRGNWFVGTKYAETNQGAAPQRIVWLPPEPGEESFSIADSVGSRFESGYEHRRIATRVVPVSIEIWGHDYGDTETLANYMSAALYTVCVGQLVVDDGMLVSGGFMREVAGDRGVRYILGCKFAFPVTMPQTQVVVAENFGVQINTV
jgi:hypothetical protein